MHTTTYRHDHHVASCCSCSWSLTDEARSARAAASRHSQDRAHPVVVRSVTAPTTMIGAAS